MNELSLKDYELAADKVQSDCADLAALVKQVKDAKTTTTNNMHLSQEGASTSAFEAAQDKLNAVVDTAFQILGSGIQAATKEETAPVPKK